MTRNWPVRTTVNIVNAYENLPTCPLLAAARIRLSDGHQQSGLLRAQTGGGIEFAFVFRDPDADKIPVMTSGGLNRPDPPRLHPRI